MSRTKRLTAFTASYSQAAVIFPYILVAPAYFADKIQLGGLTQTASAFGSVQKALSFFVTIYRTLADWRAIVARLDGFETSIASADDAGDASRLDRRRVVRRRRGDRPEPARWSACPTARRWSRPTASASAAASARCSPARPAPASRPCSAPSPASGRSAAARSPFPPTRSLMMLPQRPYFPIGSLHGGDRLSRRSRARSARTRSGSAHRWSACRSWPRGWTRKRTGTGCSRSASSSASGWRARCCTRRNICSSTKPPLRSTSRRRPRCTACSREAAGHHHRLDRPPLDAGGLPSAPCRHGPRRRPLHAAATPCERTSRRRSGRCQRCGHGRRRRHADARITTNKRGGRLLCRPFGLREEDLLQVGHRGQVSRELDDAGRAAPVGAEAARRCRD